LENNHYERPDDTPPRVGANGDGPHGGLPQALEPLKTKPRWLLWRWEEKNGKRTKPPYQINGRRASIDKPDTWCPYEQAIENGGSFDGIGYVLSPEEAAFDIDDCRDKVTGEINPWALMLVDRANSYAEITVSGTGIRIIGTGEGGAVTSSALFRMRTA
jgi:primase-polymerase (primpol)-like protein